MKKRLPFITAAVLATLFIFGNSLQNAEVSSASSGRFVSVLENILGFFKIAAAEDMLVYAVRKSAHMTEFAFQAVLLAGCFEKEYRHRIIYVLFFGLLTACTDEFIQLFSPGRAAMVQDVFIDFAGTALGTVCAGIIYKLRRK